MFTTLIVQPIFNLLVLVYAVLPGHDFGLAIILFTILVRFLMWPLIKKQLHHTKAMQKLQPEIRRIKKATKGDRQKESAMMMELYKERQINPFATIGLTLLQLPILIGLYLGLKRLIDNPKQIIDFSYPFLRDLSWLQELARDISKFDANLLGVVDLKRAAYQNGQWYIPGLVLVVTSSIAQYFQSKQLLPDAGSSKSIRQILREAKSGKTADQADMQAATSRYTALMIPAVFFFVSLGFAAALPLYWLVSSLVAIWQQGRILNQDEEEMEAIADMPAPSDGTSKSKTVIEGEVIAKKPKPAAKKTTSRKNKRRR